MEHSATGTAVGQHVVLSSTGDWSGVRKITEVLDSTHTVLDGASYADYLPAAPSASTATITGSWSPVAR